MQGWQWKHIDQPLRDVGVFSGRRSRILDDQRPLGGEDSQAVV